MTAPRGGCAEPSVGRFCATARVCELKVQNAASKTKRNVLLLFRIGHCLIISPSLYGTLSVWYSSMNVTCSPSVMAESGDTGFTASGQTPTEVSPLGSVTVIVCPPTGNVPVVRLMMLIQSFT